jgi:hypothetical protein
MVMTSASSSRKLASVPRGALNEGAPNKPNHKTAAIASPARTEASGEEHPA